MDFIIIGLIAVAFFFILQSVNKKPEVGNKITIHKKQCPPHQWFWQEVEDQHGNPHGARIVCKVCGPLSGNDPKGWSDDEV
jgi:hypothetical protein